MNEENDHRVRVAKDRRERMRKKLLNAILVSYSNKEQSIESVIAEAAVSRATFYKYFTSLDDALDKLGEELKDEIINSIGSLIGNTTSALNRMTAGIQVFLLKGVMDPHWAGFVAQTSYMSRDVLLRGMIAEDLLAAQRQGDIEFDDIHVATTLVLGTLMQAIDYLVHTGDRRRSYVEGLNITILRALGVTKEKAAEIVHDRTIYVRGLAPDRIDWWRDPWVEQ